MISIYILSGLLLLAQCNNVKYWIHSNNWNNRNSWDFAPTSCDAVVLPDLEYDYSVLLNGNVHLNSLQFPSTGEVIFGDRVSLSMSGRGQCSTSVTNTYRTEQYNWGDPNNWHTSSTSDTLFTSTDSDRIPCWADTVIFNQTTVFSVLIDSVVEVGALYFSGESVSTEQVQEFTRGPGRSQLEFINLSTLSVTGRTVCTNPEGCLCGNQLECSLVQCPRQNCVKPLKSKGICCHYCGAEVRFRPPAGFYLMRFKETLANYLRDSSDVIEQVKLTISLQEYESRINIQITVADSLTNGNFEGAGYESSKLAHDIYDYIVQYDIVQSADIRIQQSHQPHATETQKTENLKPQISGIQSWVLYVVLSVAVVMLLVIIVLLYKCSQRYMENRGHHIRLDTGALPRTVEQRFKPCVRASDLDIPTYEEVLMEDMISRGIAPDQPRSTARDAARPRPGYAEIPTTDISEYSRV